MVGRLRELTHEFNSGLCKRLENSPGNACTSANHKIRDEIKNGVQDPLRWEGSGGSGPQSVPAFKLWR